MSAEWFTAIGTLGTFVVITVSAIAALMQLRHMRGSNQIIALNECAKRWNHRRSGPQRTSSLASYPSGYKIPRFARP